MRILIIHTFYQLSGGEDTVVLNEMCLLQQNGHEVSLAQFDNSRYSLVKLLFMPFNFISFIQTIKKIKSFKPDLVHIHNMHFGASSSIIYAAHALKKPIIITLHNYRTLCPSGSLFFDGKMFLESLQSGFTWNAVKKGVYRNSKVLTFWLSLSNYLHQKFNTYAKVSAFIVLGEHARKLFADSHFRRYADKLVVKPNFAPDVKSKCQNSQGKYFLFVGRLTQEKGIETLLNAFSKSDTILKVVGSGPLESKVLDAIKNNKNIEFTGQQPANKIAELFENAEALIFPSIWFETFGMVLIEAFSNSIPVIASALGNIKNIVENGNNGLTFKAGDYLDLRTRIDYYHNLPLEQKNNYKKSARETYENKYAPLANYSEIMKIYAAAISRHSYRQ